MNIYHLIRNDDTGYDELREAVVIAEDENAARALAATHHGDEGHDRWFMPTTDVIHIGWARDDTGPCTVCADFYEG